MMETVECCCCCCCGSVVCVVGSLEKSLVEDLDTGIDDDNDSVAIG